MPKVIQVLVVDDHALFRHGVVTVFNQQPDFNVVGEAATIQEALSIVQAKFPDLVLIDVGLPDGNGVEAMERILEIHKDTWIVFLTVHESEEIAFAALHGGAKGYMIKNINIQKLLVALRAIQHGELAISRDLSSRYIEETTHWISVPANDRLLENTLTDREIEIVSEIGKRCDNQEISKHLNISPNTVKVHVNNIARKLGLTKRKELEEFAQRHGLVRSRELP